MNDGRCGTCKHWKRDEPEQELQTMRDEFKFRHYYDNDDEPLKRSTFRPCALTVYDDYRYRHPESKALAVDHEDYAAELMTAPDFGCIQHEPKE